MNSTIALAGTLVSLAVTCGLALVMASLTQLSGLASDEAQALRVTADALDLRGLLVAGIVVGALGVLDDVTVSQVSIVAALRRANPSLGARQLYAEATKVGRDHVASAVNTLALAYAGASLPLLLFFAEGGQPTGRIVTGELVAVEIVRMLVGSIGLVLSVPVTTWLAAVVLANTTDTPEPDHGHDHDHGHGHGFAVATPGPDPGFDPRPGYDPRFGSHPRLDPGLGQGSGSGVGSDWVPGSGPGPAPGRAPGAPTHPTRPGPPPRRPTWDAPGDRPEGGEPEVRPWF